MYKDKDKQREANRRAQAKFKAKGITNTPPSGITSEGITEQGITRLAHRPMAINLELCRECGNKLPPLEQPRQYPGMCLSCVKDKYSIINPGERTPIPKGTFNMGVPSPPNRARD